ncbi:MAG: hypothetical protein MHM6MM_001281 [Cercozoa sp. M6MM]
MSHEQALKSLDPEEYETRPLQRSDFDTGFLELLAKLTMVGEVDRALFERTYSEMFDDENSPYNVAVVRHRSSGKIVATAAMFVERKFIHECGKVGHIEDVVVHDEFRGKSLGVHIVNYALQIAKQQGCYKAILDCREGLEHFYNKSQLEKKGIQMAVYFDAAGL